MEQQSWSLVYYSATATDMTSLSQGVRKYLDEGGRVKIIARTGQQFFDSAQKKRFLHSCHSAQKKRFLHSCLHSDAIIISLHGGAVSFPLFDELMDALDALPAASRPFLHIQPTSGDEDSGGAEIQSGVWQRAVG